MDTLKITSKELQAAFDTRSHKIFDIFSKPFTQFYYYAQVFLLSNHHNSHGVYEHNMYVCINLHMYICNYISIKVLELHICIKYT